jgi:hypothetical protein
MWTKLIDYGADCGIVLACLIALTFILNRLGLIAWFSRVSRSKDSKQDSAAKRYWSAHE